MLVVHPDKLFALSVEEQVLGQAVFQALTTTYQRLESDIEKEKQRKAKLEKQFAGRSGW